MKKFFIISANYEFNGYGLKDIQEFIHHERVDEGIIPFCRLRYESLLKDDTLTEGDIIGFGDDDMFFSDSFDTDIIDKYLDFVPYFTFYDYYGNATWNYCKGAGIRKGVWFKYYDGFKEELSEHIHRTGAGEDSLIMLLLYYHYKQSGLIVPTDEIVHEGTHFYNIDTDNVENQRYFPNRNNPELLVYWLDRNLRDNRFDTDEFTPLYQNNDRFREDVDRYCSESTV